VLVQEAVAAQALEELETSQQSFLIMPYMQSESGMIHEQAVKLFSRPGLDSILILKNVTRPSLTASDVIPIAMRFWTVNPRLMRKSFSNCQDLDFSCRSFLFVA